MLICLFVLIAISSCFIHFYKHGAPELIQSSAEGSTAILPVDPSVRSTQADAGFNSTLAPDTLNDHSLWFVHATALQESAKKGDYAASVELYRESLACRKFHIAVDEIPSLTNDRRVTDAKKPLTSDLEEFENELSRLQTIIRDSRSLCAGSDPNSVRRVYQESLFNAAKVGYLPAVACYVGAGPDLGPDASGGNVGYRMSEYKHYEPIFTREGLEKGDWLVAQHAFDVLTESDNLMEPSTLDGRPLPDVYLTWRALLLTQYRVPTGQKNYLDGLMQSLVAKHPLSEADKLRAQKWAKSMYNSGSPLVSPLADVEHVQYCQ